MKPVKQSGFTLVELSIVLVIIGLLIGGILAAQSMIATAKVQATIKQISQFDIVVANFQNNYRHLPGDNTLFGNVGVMVDGNVTDDTGTALFFANLFTGEAGRFWYDLKMTGLRPEGNDILADCSAGCDISKNAPSGKFIANSSWFASSSNNTGPSYVYYLLGNYANAGNDFSQGEGAAKVTDILAIDLKMDDGKNIITSTGGEKIAANIATSVCSGGATEYPISQSGDLCLMLVRMGTAAPFE